MSERSEQTIITVTQAHGPTIVEASQRCRYAAMERSRRLYVVRHVKAGDRAKWNHAPDAERPISKNGQRQADAIGQRLAGAGVTRLVSSPALRCIQSLAPLSAAVGLTIETDARLFEGAAFEESLAVVRALPDHAVICSHGDVVPELISGLVRRGTELITEPDWRKATVWILDGPDERSPDGDPVFATAAVEPPPTTKG